MKPKDQKLIARRKRQPYRYGKDLRPIPLVVFGIVLLVVSIVGGSWLYFRLLFGGRYAAVMLCLLGLSAIVYFCLDRLIFDCDWWRRGRTEARKGVAHDQAEAALRSSGRLL